MQKKQKIKATEKMQATQAPRGKMKVSVSCCFHNMSAIKYAFSLLLRSKNGFARLHFFRMPFSALVEGHHQPVIAIPHLS